MESATPKAPIQRTGRLGFGAQALRIAIDYDRSLSRGLSHDQAQGELQSRPGRYNPTMLAALASFGTLARMQKKCVRSLNLRQGWWLKRASTVWIARCSSQKTSTSPRRSSRACGG